ncbi:hypothetical protein KSP40_PGU021390 [Platanthera guangdongensis]|uniref:Uncharacterized protein n=1 Tax=Platanthera guangdongensis TaxID=2320717 RepID=A0ABR2LQY7_9ASPA
MRKSMIFFPAGTPVALQQGLRCPKEALRRVMISVNKEGQPGARSIPAQGSLQDLNS